MIITNCLLVVLIYSSSFCFSLPSLIWHVRSLKLKNLPCLEVFVYVCWGLVWFELRVFGLFLNITGWITWSSWNCGGNIMWCFVDESGFQVIHSVTMISCYFRISFEDSQGKTIYSFLVSSYIELFYASFYICWWEYYFLSNYYRLYMMNLKQVKDPWDSY